MKRYISIVCLLILIGSIILLGCSIEMTIVADMQNPVTITFGGVEETLPIGSSMTVTASIDPPDDPANPDYPQYTYQWYLGGVLIDGETDISITIGSDLTEGIYRLDLEVIKGEVLSSELCFFVVE